MSLLKQQSATPCITILQAIQLQQENTTATRVNSDKTAAIRQQRQDNSNKSIATRLWRQNNRERQQQQK